MASADTQWSTLVAFEASANGPVNGVEAGVQTGPAGMVFRYVLRGDISRIRLSTAEPAGRVDGLWKHTCFEAFVKEAGAAPYREYNFSASRQWAVYAFDDYRKGMSSPRIDPPPEITVRRAKERLEIEASVKVQDPIGGPARRSLRLGLCAVIEDEDGRLTYWALKHAADKPDFHSAVAFALHLSV
jgi:hypothetical protein